jgi:hypothetical protein
MRVLVINSRSDVQSLKARPEIEKLNPHVDFKKIEPGTVLLLPDPPAATGTAGTATEGKSIQGQVFDDLQSEVTKAVEASGARVRRGYEALTEEAKEVNAVLKTAAVKRLVDADPDLKQQADAAAAVFKQDAADAKAADQALRSIQQQATEELGNLAKLLG